MPRWVVLKYTLKNINLVYEKETLYGEVIKVCTSTEEIAGGAVCSHKILDREGNILNIAETRWG